MMAINYALKLIKKQGIEQPIFYVLGNTPGAFVGPLRVRSIKWVADSISTQMDWSENGPSGPSRSKPISSILKRS